MSFLSAGKLTYGACSLAASVTFAVSSGASFKNANTSMEEAKKVTTIAEAVTKIEQASNQREKGYISGFCSLALLGASGLTVAARRRQQQSPAPTQG